MRAEVNMCLDHFERPICSRPRRSSGWNMITSTITPMLITCSKSQLSALSCNTSDSHANRSTIAMPLNTALARVCTRSRMM